MKKTYYFVTPFTSSLFVAIIAEDEKEAWEGFDMRVDILAGMGVKIPERTAWYITTIQYTA